MPPSCLSKATDETGNNAFMQTLKYDNICANGSYKEKPSLLFFKSHCYSCLVNLVM